MKTTMCSRAGAAALCAAILISSGVAGCAGKRRGKVHAPAAQPITIDGHFEDWPKEPATIASADWIFFRVAVENQAMPLQASPEPLSLWLDADANGSTGVRMPSPAPAAELGIDLVVEYSPTGGNSRGAQVYAIDNEGNRTPLSFSQVGLSSAPTFSAGAFEIRISRHIDPAAAPGLAAAMDSRGNARGMFVLADGTGKLVGWSDPETFAKPARAAAAPTSDVVVPTKPADAVRIVSYNVLKSKLATEPSAFARLIQVLQPDVILFQEWDADAATATAWFTAVVSGQTAWNARASSGDVVIVSPHPIAPLGPDSVAENPGSEAPSPRFVAGIVATPIGDVAVGSMHLKCCGTAGSREDIKRIAEAGAINAAMQTALLSGPAVRVFGGDLNLVGSRTPIETLCAGLDSDGTSLVAAEAMVLGDTTHTTWSDDPSGFPPGRLDYMVYSDASAVLVNAFVLDTRRLGQQALARMGLDAGDSAASDHQPVVIDLRPR